VFSDAIFPLSESLGRGTGTVYAADWGLYDTLLLLHQGKLRMLPRGDEIASDARNPAQENALRQMVLDAQARIVTHVPEREVYPGQLQKLDAYASALGLKKDVLETIQDSNHRPVFLVLRYLK
jgi:hypothetical protein